MADLYGTMRNTFDRRGDLPLEIRPSHRLVPVKYHLVHILRDVAELLGDVRQMAGVTNDDAISPAGDLLSSPIG